VSDDAQVPVGRDGCSELLRRGYSRRQILRFGVAAIALPTLLDACGGQSPHQMTLDQALGLNDNVETFSSGQLRSVRAVLARLIPTDENGPGATEAKVWRYIDRALAHDYSELKPLYTANLAALDKYSQQEHGHVFADLSGTEQDSVLTAVEAGHATGFTPTSTEFFELIREHALEGMFGDPYHGGNANFVGWNLIQFPGILDVNPVAYQQVGVAIPVANRSVAQFDGMFQLQTGGG